jgi:pyrophosphate--fructose-6-phosphate 1-phosphotransferase
LFESPFHKARTAYAPRHPRVLSGLNGLATKDLEPGLPDDDADRPMLEKTFPRTYGQPVIEFVTGNSTTASHRAYGVGIVLSGGPAPGGHNVIWGIADGLTALATGSGELPRLVGFRGGPSGILDDKTFELTARNIERYRNTGGFDLLGSGRTKIETPEQFARCRDVLEKHKLDVLVIIGGDDSNTNAAALAEYLLAQGSKVRVIGVPKTIDGDLKNRYVQTSFGFDTAVRVYSELIANIARDALSAKKYYHFVRLMGRSASHITLEAALQTQVNLALIAEEVAASGKTLRQVVEDVGALIKERALHGKNYGLILVPEGLIEFIPEVKALIKELNDILAEHKDYVATLSGFTEKSEYVNRKLSKDASYTFASFPIDIQRQLLLERDPHGNVVVSLIETEKLLIEMLSSYLGEEKAEGRFSGTFGHQRHFLGYEGRCAAPTNFDADYAYSLGLSAVALIAAGVTGYMSVVTGLATTPDQWRALGVPLSAMMTIETRKGKPTPVIKKALVDLSGDAFKYFQAVRASWRVDDQYRFAGPIQYFGPGELIDRAPACLTIEQTGSIGVSW